MTNKGMRRPLAQVCHTVADAMVVVYLVLLLLLMLLSWMGDVYGWGVGNLLSREGLCWGCSHLTANVSEAPLGGLLLLIICISTLIESGLLAPRGKTRRKRSLRERKALQAVAVLVLLIVIVLGAMLVSASPLILSPLGRFSGSPLQHSALPLALLLLTLLALVYGISAGRFLSFGDVLRACVLFLIRYPTYVLSVFTGAQLLAALRYALPTLSATTFLTAEAVVYGLPLLLYLANYYLTTHNA